jgi:hypothetical protein
MIGLWRMLMLLSPLRTEETDEVLSVQYKHEYSTVSTAHHYSVMGTLLRVWDSGFHTHAPCSLFAFDSTRPWALSLSVLTTKLR